MNIRMLVPVSRAFPTALRSKKEGSKNVTAAGWRGYVDGTNEKLSHAERCAEHSKNKPNPRSSCSLDIWTPTLTLSRRGRWERFLGVLWYGICQLLVVMLVGRVSSFPCNPEDLQEATSEAAGAPPQLELPKTLLFPSTFFTSCVLGCV